jgi:hypothetical protein
VSRLSEKELWAKITRLREKIGAGDWLFVDPLKVVPQFQALNLWTEDERAAALEASANEIRPEHYRGGRPPLRAYAGVCANAELFTFAWKSTHFGKQMYLKFCFVKETLFLVSVHRDEPEKTRKGRS